MMLALLLVVGVCYLAHLLTRRPSSQGRRSVTSRGRDRSALRRRQSLSSNESITEQAGWTALDDYQLNRLLDEHSP